jgi:hypothetical protein
MSIMQKTQGMDLFTSGLSMSVGGAGLRWILFG